MNTDEAFFIAKEITKKELMEVACSFRLSCFAATRQEFDPLTALEHVLPRLDKDFNYHIIEASAWNFGRHIHALCIAEQHTILIRDDVYCRACSRSYFDSITIMHEISHYLLFIMYGIPVKTAIEELPSGKLPENRDPEIQADTLARFILFPDCMIAEWHGSIEDLLYRLIIKPVTEIITKEALRAEKQCFAAQKYTYTGGDRYQ